MSNVRGPELIKQFLSSLPAQMQGFNQQMLEELAPRLESWFQSLNLVTADELQQQVKIVKRCQQQLEALQAELATLKQTAESEI